ncbi:hypothetical protein KP79_PYT23519 [Mizuhopecten yessoensis]|uniref:Uncharacterized protein n=1 Tax=Mizuhopecten yessoensis TaxID=6573 RepID=A0A210QMS0_MIZYE|nr:hypothetical protein KP79_PYT23519 [Mizuhopecten yessoensis]
MADAEKRRRMGEKTLESLANRIVELEYLIEQENAQHIVHELSAVIDTIGDVAAQEAEETEPKALAVAAEADDNYDFVSSTRNKNTENTVRKTESNMRKCMAFVLANNDTRNPEETPKQVLE